MPRAIGADLRVSSHCATLKVAGLRRNPDEINDRPVRCDGRTEFGLPPSYYEGRFGNEASFAFCYLCLRRFFHLIDAFFDFLNGGMQFLKNLVLFPRKFFDAAGLLVQFFEHRILALGDAIHPPKTNPPAANIKKANEGYDLPHRTAIVFRCTSGGLHVRYGFTTYPSTARVLCMFAGMSGWLKRTDWRIPAAWLTLCIIWSSTWLAIKVGLRDLPPVSYVGIRFVIAFIALIAVSIGRTALLPKRGSDYAVLAFTGVLMFSINYTLLFWGELYVSSGLAAILQASIPIFGMVFAHWILPEEPLRWQRLLGAFVSIGGVALICARLLSFNGWPAFFGGLGITVGAAGAAFSNVLLKSRRMELAPAMMAAWQMIFGVMPLLVLGLLLDGNPARFHWTGMAIFCLLYLAIIGSSLTFLLLYWLMPRMSVTKLQTISLITPPGAIAIGWALGGEHLSAWSLLGAGLVLSGVWMIFRPVPDERQAAKPGLKSQLAAPRA